VAGRNVNNLPLNGRNSTFFAQRVAGVYTPQVDTRGGLSMRLMKEGETPIPSFNGLGEFGAQNVSSAR
jgi:hypothetical protein